MAAFGYSIVSVLRGSGHVYFEVGSMVLLFVSIGRWLEAKGKQRTGHTLDSLAGLLPDIVRIKNADGQFQEAERQVVRTSDILRVLPGERFPVDGIIVSGQASVDQQIVTGESRLVEKTLGDQVYSGTLNSDGDLQLEVTSADGQETVSKILNMIRSARKAKGRQERLADRIAYWFIPAVCIIAVWSGVHSWQLNGLDQGIMTGLAVVLIACPCAIGLATPMAVWTALGRAAEGGVLFRSGLVMEKLAGVNCVCFDKTGTLTTGVSKASNFISRSEEECDTVLQIATNVAAGSNHHLSQAICNFSDSIDIGSQTNEVQDVKTLPGLGLVAQVPNIGEVFLGSRRLMDESKLTLSDNVTAQFEEQATPHQKVFVGWDSKVQGLFLFEEQVRPEADEALTQCQEIGLELHLLTGDEQSDVISSAFPQSVSSQCKQLPGDKVSSVEALAKKFTVAMVGDGLNDAPALASADVGVALGCGADVSRDVAGVCLLGNDLRRFPWAIQLAKNTHRVVKQNLFWAFSYNAVGIALAATGRLNPIWAALAMAVSSILVVTNSLRLSQFPEPVTISEDQNKGPISDDSDQNINQSKNLLETKHTQQKSSLATNAL